MTDFGYAFRARCTFITSFRPDWAQAVTLALGQDRWIQTEFPGLHSTIFEAGRLRSADQLAERFRRARRRRVIHVPMVDDAVAAMRSFKEWCPTLVLVTSRLLPDTLAEFAAPLAPFHPHCHIIFWEDLVEEPSTFFQLCRTLDVEPRHNTLAIKAIDGPRTSPSVLPQVPAAVAAMLIEPESDAAGVAHLFEPVRWVTPKNGAIAEVEKPVEETEFPLGPRRIRIDVLPEPGVGNIIAQVGKFEASAGIHYTLHFTAKADKLRPAAIIVNGIAESQPELDVHQKFTLTPDLTTFRWSFLARRSGELRIYLDLGTSRPSVEIERTMLSRAGFAYPLICKVGDARVDTRRTAEGLRIDLDSAFAHKEDVQLVYPTHPVHAGVRYRLSYRARADSRKRIGSGVTRGQAPYGGINFYYDFDVTTNWKYCHLEEVAKSDDPTPRILFDVGNNGTGLEIADIQFRAADERLDREAILSIKAAFRTSSSIQRIPSTAG